MTQISPASMLQLRMIADQYGPTVQLAGKQLGQPIAHRYGYFLAGRPVCCGDTLEVFRRGQWIFGRYHWTTNPADQPMLEAENLVIGLDATHLLRWPQ